MPEPSTNLGPTVIADPSVILARQGWTAEDMERFEAANKAYQAGHEAGLAGLPLPESANEQAWLRGGIERRARAGEIVAVVTLGSRCNSCGDQNYGWRMGCRCWSQEQTMAAFTGADNAPQMEWGALALPNTQALGTPLVFMSRDDLLAARAAGKEVVDSDSGEPIVLDEGDPEPSDIAPDNGQGDAS